jgi:hypothetical protein
MSGVEDLWGPAEVARFLGYAESTVVRMATMEPAKLPPRVAGVTKSRWVPEVCRKWALARSAPVEKRKIGRPRKVVV